MTTLHLLDVPHLRDGTRRVDLPSSVPGFLIGYLAANANWVAREALSALLWPEHGEAEAQRALRVSLHRMKSWLESHGLAANLQAERRRVRLSVDCDVVRFRAAIGRGDWAQALQLHRAPLMSGLVLAQHPVASEWLDLERPALLEAWRRAALREAARLEAEARWADAAGILIEQLQHELLTEDVVQALLRVAQAAGQREPALALYARFAERLQSQLGLLPLPVTQSLARALQANTLVDSRPRPVVVTAGAKLAAPVLTGRPGELRQLADPERNVVLVTGEPGIGKTLLLESAHPAAAWLGCREDWRAAPLQPVIDYLDDTLEAVQALPEFQIHRLEVARVLPRAVQGELVLPDAPAPGSDATRARRRLLDALADVLLGLGRPLIFDDLHWADDTTLDLIELLGARGVRSLFATARSTEIDRALQHRLNAWATRGWLQRIDLAPLDVDAIASVVRQMLPQPTGGAVAAPAFARWLHGYTGGNPLFAVETLRALSSEQRLAAASGQWGTDLDRISQDYAELMVSGRLAELVQRRVRALPDAAQRALTVAAIAGDAGHVEPLAEVAGLSAWAMAEAVGQAQEAGLLQGRRFSHELVRAAVVQATPEALRSVLHASIARRCEALLPAHRIAQHWWAAQDTGNAVDALLRACGGDRARGLHADVALALQSWLERIEALPLRARLHAELALTRLQIDQTEAAEAQVELALDALPDPDTRSRALCVRAEVAFRQGRLQAAEQAIASAEESSPERFEVLTAKARVTLAGGQPDAALSAMRQAERMLRRQQPGPQLASVLTGIGALLDEKGQVDAGLPYHREAWALARRLGARYVQVDVAVNMLWGMPVLDQHAQAIEIAREALAFGDYDGTPTLRNNLAWLLVDMGRLDEALPLYRQLADGDDPTLRCTARAKLVDIHARQGDAPGVAAAVEATLSAMAQTDVYLAHAAAMAAVLTHGESGQAQQALAWRRDHELDPWLQERLDAAIKRHAERLDESVPSAPANTALVRNRYE